MTIISTPHIADALRVASPTLAENLVGWEGRGSLRRRERMERTLVQYFARMCDRCTPFGLFAGVSVGEVAGETRLRLAGLHRYRRRSALDLAQVSALVRWLMKNPVVRENVRYRVNDTLASVSGGYQYVEANESNGERRHEIAFLEADQALEAALDGAALGAGLAEIRRALAARISDPQIGDRDLVEYLDDLIGANVIEPELIPAVVGNDPLDQILECLEATEALSRPAAGVRRFRSELDRLDACGVGAPPEAYAAVNGVWTNELRQEKTDRLLQVDMYKEAADLRLSEVVVAEVLRAAEPLWRLAGPAPDPLRDLKNRFRERYGSREVSLAEAFDPERGLGAPGPDLRTRAPGSPLLAELAMEAEDGRADGPRRTDSADELANRLLDLTNGTIRTLELDDNLLDRLAPWQAGPLPDSLGLHFDLIAPSEAAVQAGNYRLLFHTMLGPSGARMLGRFCDLDPGLLERVRGHLRDEEALAPGEVYAEVVHSPEGRVGNVVRRPHVREVELSNAGHSRRDATRRLTVDDIAVSVRDGRFVLRSQRDNRIVQPRLTSAHNFRRSWGMYRFLCALQNDGTHSGFGWNWGALNGLPFLPRVTRGRAVYSLARWNVRRERPAYDAIGKATTSTERERAFATLVEELRLPRFVRLRDGDNRLLLDLENSLCAAVVADHASRRPALILEETLAEDLEGCITGPEGKFRNEIILPLVRRQPAVADRQVSVRKHGRSTAASVRHVFAPGEQWLYFKLYAALGTADRLLRELVTPLAALHRTVATDERWFFIRYSDPEPHIRIRFRAAPDALRVLEQRMSSLVRPLVREGSIQRVTIDTYVREAERYGGERGIELAEMWFHHDSVAVLRLLELVEAATDENLRWKAVAMGFDRLLADFGLDYAERERVVGSARESFAHEFRVGTAVRRRLAKRLRRERGDLEALVVGTGEEVPRLAAFHGLFRDRSARTTRIVRAYRQLDQAGDLECPLDEVLRSLTHMHANRVFPASARAHELVIHDFLSRTYRSLIARARR
ncbi:MAG: lantibiotic dehydratase [Gemmatimonadota bacterium]|nr:lantibiotic dehydratase [Gemmatimonadota bacterium]